MKTTKWSSIKLSCEDKRRQIADLMARGIYVKSEIARRLNLPWSTVSDHVNAIYQEWREEHQSDIDDAIRRQLLEIVWQRNEVQEQWERTKQDAESETVKSGLVTETTSTRKGQTGNPSYMQVLSDLRDEERKLLGVDKRLEELAKPQAPDIRSPDVMTPEEKLAELSEIANRMAANDADNPTA